MKKRTVLISSLAAVVSAALAIGGTAAYFTSQPAPVTNTFTVGNVEIELAEETWDNSGKAVAEHMVPGETASKDPVVKNTGINPCYVRLSVTGVTVENGIITAPDGFAIKGATLGTGPDHWTYDNGYFYYNSTLPASAATSALFTGVSMENDATEGNVNAFDMVITAQAVQCEGGFAPDGDFLASAKAAFSAQIS